MLHLVPRTAIAGAVLCTRYLGGALTTHMRLEDPLLTHVLFPIDVAIVLWLPLWLGDPRARARLEPIAGRTRPERSAHRERARSATS